MAFFPLTLPLEAQTAGVGAPAASQALPGEARLDLASLGAGTSASLDGEWDFWWQAFIVPGSPLPADLPPPSKVRLPGEWKDYGQGFPPTGYGSYRLILTGLDPRRTWGLRMGSFLSAARVFVNGSLVMDFGRPGTDAASEQPGWSSRLAFLRPAADGSAEVIIHLSNFADRSGGLRTGMLAGDYPTLAGKRDRTRLFELFSIGAILVMGLYYLFLHAFRPSERPPLYFGLLCLLLALRITCYDEYFLLDLLPDLSWDWLFRLGYLTFSLAVMLTTLFITSLFPKRSWKPATWAVVIVSNAYSGIILLAPTLLVSGLLPAFQAVTGLAGIYLLVTLVRAIIRRESGSLLFLGGFLLFFAAAIFDILVANGMVKSTFVVQYGLLVFLFSMSLVITKKLAGAFAITEGLTAELSRTNRAMKRFVPAEFLGMLGKSTVEQVGLGDNARQELAVMFADIRSFSTISEKLSPEDTFRFINQYLARMGPTIRDHGGFVDKYLGDGIMALFPGSPADAARCAVAMHRRLEEYNSQRSVQGEVPIKIGIGIHYGGIMLGTIGENERMDGTVISDAVNVASRFEGIAKEFGVGVVAGEGILKALGSRSGYRSRYLGKVGVKGKRDPVPVFELYDGDPEELRLRKDGIRADFETALDAFYAQDYGRALALFREVSERMPEDDATQYYQRIIRKLNLS